uniref:TadE-like domain-containing protein n=1 Tax=Solibacter usitatus (strain Ellin6076) TaxID=234267 RepID=Q01XW5_SOLUE
MKRKSKGVAIVEFSFAMLVVVPLLLGTVGFGIRLVQSMQTIQLARDAGRMYARGLKMYQDANKTILAKLGADIGLKTDGTGNSVLILSKVMYVDKAKCVLAGKSIDPITNEPIGCTNYKFWVFAERLVIGNASIHTSNLGSPLTTGTTGVTVDSTTGAISDSDQVNQTGAQAQFSDFGNPFVAVGGSAMNTLPSGQVLYVTEAASQGFTMAPFASGGLMYAYTIF